MAWAIPIHAASAQTKTEAINPPTNVQPIQEEKRETVLRPLPRTTGNRYRTPLQKSINERHPNSESFGGRHYSKEEIQVLIRSYSAQYEINPEVPLCIARLESGYNQFSKNRSSSASGVFQYLSSTWRSTDEGKSGLSVFDADANVIAAIKYMSSRRNTKPWVVASKCPSFL